MKRISKKQKRVKVVNKRTASRVSRHLTMGDQHDWDRAAAARIRAFPIVPRLIQAPFPRERTVGFAGHYVNGELVIQKPDDFVAMNVEYKADAWYFRRDPRGNRQPRIQPTGIVETNIAVSTGLAKVLAGMAEEGKFSDLRQLSLCAAQAGMQALEKRTGYRAAYIAAHPDAEGTFSFHFGLWPVDRAARCLIGRSASGKRGKKGLRNLGDAFMSVLRHHLAIGLPAQVVALPLNNLAKRDPDDWAVGLAMDQALREEIAKLSKGAELLQQAEIRQQQAARDWLERYMTGAAGLVGLKIQLDAAGKKLERRKKAAGRLLQLTFKKRTSGNADTTVLPEKEAIKERAENIAVGEVSILSPGLSHEHAGALEMQKQIAQDLASLPEIECKKTMKNSEADLVALLIIGRMEKSGERYKWDTGGTTEERATAFLSWLENEPIRLMAKFKKLIQPVVEIIRHYPPARKLLEFVGLGKSM